jgi:hypothetical protein
MQVARDEVSVGADGLRAGHGQRREYQYTDSEGGTALFPSGSLGIEGDIVFRIWRGFVLRREHVIVPTKQPPPQNCQTIDAGCSALDYEQGEEPESEAASSPSGGISVFRPSTWTAHCSLSFPVHCLSFFSSVTSFNPHPSPAPFCSPLPMLPLSTGVSAHQRCRHSATATSTSADQGTLFCSVPVS